MKIYFEDGTLRSSSQLSFTPDTTLDAAYGPTACMDELELIQKYKPDSIVYTNCSKALASRYHWNAEEHIHECFIRAGEHMVFTQIQKLTERELRFAHNIEKLYFAGEFQTYNKEL